MTASHGGGMRGSSATPGQDERRVPPQGSVLAPAREVGCDPHSLELIRHCRLAADDPVIDVTGGSLELAQFLLDAGFRDVTFIEPSWQLREALRERIGDRGDRVRILPLRLAEFRPQRRYALWHDAGVFRGLKYPEDRQQYVETVQQALRHGGRLLLVVPGHAGLGGRDRPPADAYTIPALGAVLGGQFELAEHAESPAAAAATHPHHLLHCCFRRHAPQWPH